MTTSDFNQVYEIGIVGRVTWNLHSLNNEGTIGNVVEPRTLKLADNTTADGISGEMLKHIHAAKLWELEANKDRFCVICQKKEPMRADDPRRGIRNKVKTPVEAMKKAISDCFLCDLHGFLIQRPTVARQSVVEFGWAVSIRDSLQRDIHTHARHSVLRGEESQARTQSDDETEREDESQESQNEDEREEQPASPERERRQMTYNRPTRSGIYAVVSVFQPWRIGLNTVDYTYPDDLNRQERYRLALQAYEAMFLRTDGAMTSTRLPHLWNFEGALVVSSTNYPVPVVSPLKSKYRNELESLAEATENSFDIRPFDDLKGFILALRALHECQPYSLPMPSGPREKADG